MYQEYSEILEEKLTCIYRKWPTEQNLNSIRRQGSSPLVSGHWSAGQTLTRTAFLALFNENDRLPFFLGFVGFFAVYDCIDEKKSYQHLQIMIYNV